MAVQTHKPAVAVPPDLPKGGRPRRRLAHLKSRLTHWGFVGPATVLFIAFFAYPLVASVWQSFTADKDGETVFVGLDQYQRMLDDPVLRDSLVNAGLLLIIQVPLMIGLALVLAGVLNASWLKFRGSWRLIYFLPAVTTLVAYSVVFRVLLKTDGGVVNQLVEALGFGAVDWLNDPTWARISLIASITWRWTGYNAVILLAGLQAIGREQYEAASIDGAGAFTTFTRVIVPQLRPVILFCTITSTIGTLQLFDENYVLTRGGPDNATMSPVLYLYKVGFDQMDFGYAAAIAWVVVLLIGLVSLVQFRLLGRERKK